jgi:hypothetical protein
MQSRGKAEIALSQPEAPEHLPAWAVEGALEINQRIAVASIMRAFEQTQAEYAKHLADAERLRNCLLQRNEQLQLSLQQQLTGLQGMVNGLSAEVLYGRER